MASHHRLFARSLAVIATLAVSLSAAGCGDQDQGPGYANGDAGGITFAHRALTKDEIMRAIAVASQKAGSSHSTIKMTGAARMRASGDASYGKGTTLMSMRMSSSQMGKGTMAVRLVGRMLYLQIPGLTPPGKFLAVDTTDPRSPLAKQFAGLGDQMDPMARLEEIGGAVLSADRVGKQTMGTTETEHYKVVVDSAPIAKQMGEQAAQQAHLPEQITYELWLDEKNLVHRMTFELPGVRFESEMSRWGEPVKVRKPAPSQIATLPQA